MSTIRFWSMHWTGFPGVRPASSLSGVDGALAEAAPAATAMIASINPYRIVLLPSVETVDGDPIP